MGFDRKTTEASGGKGAGSATSPLAPGKRTRVEELAQRTPGVAAIRAELAADPVLGRELEGYFAEGNDAPALNDLLGRAFARTPGTGTGDKSTTSAGVGTSDKAGTGAGATLPADRSDSKTLTKGVYKWTFKAETTSRPLFEADFLPDKTKVDAKNVSFAQTVVNQVGSKRFYPGGTTASPDKEKATYTPYEESTSHTRMDHFPGTENDPYYGAEWNTTAKKWDKETTPNSKLGSSVKGTSSSNATMRDRPERDPVAREGLGDVVTEFETVALVLETREPLGSLKWGLKIEDKPDAPLVLTGGTKVDCTDAPSTAWGTAMDKFYEAKFETMLDEFDAGKADLKPSHTAKLDTLATKLKASSALTAELSGAADLKEADPAKISDDRAKAARDYLVSKGVTASQLTVVALGSDWARVETTAGKDEPKNRRVQIWVKK